VVPRHITDFRHWNRDETDVIMTKIRGKWAGAGRPGLTGGLAEPDGAVLAQRAGAGLGDPAGLDGVGERAWRRASAGHHLGEGGQLGAERAAQPVHEEGVRLPVRERDIRLGRPAGAGQSMPPRTC
jgi:hypothetical protein